MTIKNKKILIAILVILFLSFAGILVWIINKKSTDKEYLYWEIYQYDDWGFSMRIPPDYKKDKEEEIERETIKVKYITFLKGKEGLTISIDQSKDIEMLRPVLLDAVKEIDISQKKVEQFLQYFFTIEEPGIEVISVKTIKKGTCVGFDYTEKKAAEYERNLVLTSLNLEDMYLTISFEDYAKDSEFKISKMVETIECTK